MKVTPLLVSHRFVKGGPCPFDAADPSCPADKPLRCKLGDAANSTTRCVARGVAPPAFSGTGRGRTPSAPPAGGWGVPPLGVPPTRDARRPSMLRPCFRRVTRVRLRPATRGASCAAGGATARSTARTRLCRGAGPLCHRTSPAIAKPTPDALRSDISVLSVYFERFNFKTSFYR